MFMNIVVHMSMLLFIYRHACSIELEERVIVTGGAYTPSKVSVYTIEGWQRDLADLGQGRQGHGCGHYTNKDNAVVKFIYKMWFSVFMIFRFVIQVFLVTGGAVYDSTWNYLSTTEILVEGDSSWTTVGNLPKAVQGIRGVSFNNRIIMTGEQRPR